jgi:hypothetical protein
MQNRGHINVERDERLGALFEKELSPTRIWEELQFHLNAVVLVSICA